MQIKAAFLGSKSASLSSAARRPSISRPSDPPFGALQLLFFLIDPFSLSLTFDRLEPRLDFVEVAPARLLHKDVVGLHQEPFGVVRRNRVRFLEERRCKAEMKMNVGRG